MIEMLEGVPGSGKSYYAVSERLLKWVRANRRVYVFVDGFYLDRLAMFEGRDLADLQKQITIWESVDEVRQGLLTVEPGSAVLLDEVQTIFRSKEKQDPEVLRWLETHRHRGIDLVIMCQQYGQVTLGVNRLVEVTTKFRRLDRFGLKNRYQAQVRGNPEETEVIRMFTGRYEPKLYAYYSSYASASIRETQRGGSIMKSPTLLLGVAGLIGAFAWVMWGGWLTGTKVHDSAKGVTVQKLPPPPLPVSRSGQGVQLVEVPTGKPLRILGGMTVFRDGKEVWVYVTASGKVLTQQEITGLSGGMVTAKMERGIRVLSGPGILWGAEEPEELASVQTASAVMAPAAAPVVEVPANQPISKESMGTSEPLTTPPGILDGGPGILGTPPSLR